MIVLLLILILALSFYILWYDHLYAHKQLKKTDPIVYQSPEKYVIDESPVPVEDHIVPTHASHTNKMNDMIGNVNSSEGVGPGLLEVVVPSDFYWSTKHPQKYRWPSGSILPDYIYE